MLKYSRPGNLSNSLEETYRYLLPYLSRILGSPISLERTSSNDTTPTSKRDDGSLAIRLPGVRNSQGNNLLILPALAAKDEYCRRITGRFVGMCKRLTEPVKKSWDLKVQLIREEQFLWDNLLLSMIYGGNQKYVALDLVAASRDALHFRYEGRPVDFGYIATWNWYLLRPLLEKAGCKLIDFKKPFDLRQRLKADKATHLLADGANAFFVVRSRGEVGHLVIFPNSMPSVADDGWELVPARYRRISKILSGRDLVLSNTINGDLLLFNKHCVLKWASGSWYRVSGDILSQRLKNYLPTSAIQRLIEVVVSLSDQRQGGLLVVCCDPTTILSGASQGVTKRFANGHSISIDQISLGTVTKLASIDGALILDSKGTIWNAGVIVKVPEEHTKAGEGARTAAASFSSLSGIAIKVSHDGPISVYESGSLVQHSA